MTTKAEGIALLSAAGYAVIPVKGKVPIEKGWENTLAGKHTVATIGASNYGIALGPEDLVIDSVPRYYARGDKPLERLAKDTGTGGKFPQTYVIKTGGGGLHIWFKKPADVAVVNSLKAYPGVEFKAGPGRQVVGPGSIHPVSGKAYEVSRGSPSMVAQAQAALLELIRASKAAPLSNGANGTGEYKDDEATKDRYKAFLETTEPAVEGSRGDHTTFATAAHGRESLTGR